ncbi:MAG: serine/threonine protein kinase [Phycisphaerales bacterium]|nr:serine/threonine protein kinase [Phycisphaerales bacterium]
MSDDQNASSRPDHLRRVRDLFGRAIELPRGRWAEFLATECNGDAAIRAGVERLLAQHAATRDDFLETPAVSLRVAPLHAWAAGLVGRRIGNYSLLRVIAVGGMGSVFEARQEHPDRLVAVKLLSPGSSATSALARFRMEPELLGRLRHPNIAQVFESGVHDGETGPVPYFAMELIPEARSIVEYAVARGLDTPRRLELFAQVCDGVHHGHQKGVSHRDLKPANSLVGADAAPKIIDFGVARATDADLMLTTQCTHVGDLIGTIRYMSPEQCDGDPARIDTRSDVYSLGMVLYELLTGRMPYDTGTTNALGALRVIQENAPTPPSDVDRSLRGNLDAIVLKALEKEPARRYQSAAHLAQDIRRHVAREPIEARPPTRWVRLTRWIARRPVLSTAILCLAMLATAGAATLGSAWYSWRSYWRPDRLRYDHEKRATEVVTVSGVSLWRWENTNGNVVESFIARPAQLGGGQLAIVSFLRTLNQENDVALKAFDVDASFDEPVWTLRMEEGDLNEYCRRRGYTPRSFSPTVCGVADIFPLVPGDEIVIGFQNSPNSQCLIRIYDLQAEPLYQVWQDGGISDVHWMSEAGILVFSGSNGVVPFEKRDSPECRELPLLPEVGESGHPSVVFGIRPRQGAIESDFLASSPTAAAPRAEWYVCAWPPALTLTRWRSGGLSAPVTGPPGSAVAFHLRDTVTGSTVYWELDATGKIIPMTFRASDRFGRDPSLPDPGVFDLRPLPPVRGFAEEPRVTPIDGSGVPLTIP